MNEGEVAATNNGDGIEITAGGVPQANQLADTQAEGVTVKDGSGEIATTTADVVRPDANGDGVLDAEHTEPNPEAALKKVEDDITATLLLDKRLEQILRDDPANYAEAADQRLRIIQFQKWRDFVNTSPEMAALFDGKHPVLTSILRMLEKSKQEQPNPGVVAEASTDELETVPQPNLTVDQPPTTEPTPEAEVVDPLANRKPEEILAFAEIWLSMPENSSSTAPLNLISALKRSITHASAEYKGYLQQIRDPDEFRKVLAASRTELNRYHDLVLKLSERTEKKVEDTAPDSIKNARTKKEMEDACNPYGAGDPKYESTNKRRKEAWEKIKGFTSLTLTELADKNRNSSMQTLLNFLITGADGSYGGGMFRDGLGRQKDAYEGVENVVFIEREPFAELLEKDPERLAKVFAQAYFDADSAGNSLQSMELYLPDEQRKLLEKWRSSPVDKSEAIQNLPALLAALNNHCKSDSDQAGRWNAARRTLGEKMTGKKDHILNAKSGLDYYTFVEEEQWKHWGK